MRYRLVRHPLLATQTQRRITAITSSTERGATESAPRLLSLPPNCTRFPEQEPLLFRDGYAPPKRAAQQHPRPLRQTNRPITGHLITNTPLTQTCNHTRSFAVSHRPFEQS